MKTIAKGMLSMMMAVALAIAVPLSVYADDAIVVQQAEAVITIDENRTLYLDASTGECWFDEANREDAGTVYQYDENTVLDMKKAEADGVFELVTVNGPATLGSAELMVGIDDGPVVVINTGTDITFTGYVNAKTLSILGSMKVEGNGAKEENDGAVIRLTYALGIYGGSLTVNFPDAEFGPALDIIGMGVPSGNCSLIILEGGTLNVTIDASPDAYVDGVAIENGNARIGEGSSYRFESNAGGYALSVLPSFGDEDGSETHVILIEGATFECFDSDLENSDTAAPSGIFCQNLYVYSSTVTMESGTGDLSVGINVIDDFTMGSQGEIDIQGEYGILVGGDYILGDEEFSSAATVDVVAAQEALRVGGLLEVHGQDRMVTRIHASLSSASCSDSAAVNVGYLSLGNATLTAIASPAESLSQQACQQAGLIIRGEEEEPMDPVSLDSLRAFSLDQGLSASVTDSTIEATGPLYGMKVGKGALEFVRSEVHAEATANDTAVAPADGLSPASIPAPTNRTTAAVYMDQATLRFSESAVSAVGGDYGWLSTYDPGLAVLPLEKGTPSPEPVINRVSFEGGTFASCEGDISGMAVSTEINISESSLFCTSRTSQPQDDGTAYAHAPAVFLMNHNADAGNVITVSEGGLLHERYLVPVTDAIPASEAKPTQAYHTAWNIADTSNYTWRVFDDDRIVIKAKAEGLYTTAGVDEAKTGLRVIGERSGANASEKVVLDPAPVSDDVSVLADTMPSTHRIALDADFSAKAVDPITPDPGPGPGPSKVLAKTGDVSAAGAVSFITFLGAAFALLSLFMKKRRCE